MHTQAGPHFEVPAWSAWGLCTCAMGPWVPLLRNTELMMEASREEVEEMEHSTDN